MIVEGLDYGWLDGGDNGVVQGEEEDLEVPCVLDFILGGARSKEALTVDISDVKTMNH